VILSDHGMTPARSYRVRFGESLGATVENILDGDVLSSHSDRSEYADIGSEVLEAVAVITPPASKRRRIVRRARDWVRSRYGLREIIVPEKFRVATTHDVVVTYSSCLALLYFADDERQLSLQDILGDPRRSRLYSGLLGHAGIGLVATRTPQGVHVESKSGKGLIHDGSFMLVQGENPMDVYGSAPHELRAVESLVLQSNAGDLVLFGAYDGSDIISFDDQVGAHGSAGGDQTYPFLITPSWLEASSQVIEDARDIHRAVLLRYIAGTEAG